MLEGKNKSLNEQIDILYQILSKSKKIMSILKVLEEYAKENKEFRNYYLAAGCINQTVLNYYHDKNLGFGIKDYDIAYFDEDTTYEKEDIIIKDLEKRLKHLNVSLDIKNQKRVPIWYKEKYGIEKREYQNTEEAISRWGTTITCIGIRLEDSKPIICCPYGLNDLFSLIVRPITQEYGREAYLEKSNRWKNNWPKLEIKEYNER